MKFTYTLSEMCTIATKDGGRIGTNIFQEAHCSFFMQSHMSWHPNDAMGSRSSSTEQKMSLQCLSLFHN